MRNRIPIVLALFSLLIGCLKDEPLELEFVEVSLETPEVTALNRVRLRANVNDLIRGTLQERGFLLSTVANDENSLVLGGENVDTVAPDVFENKTFFGRNEWRANTVGAPYYTRAYVVFEGAPIYSQNIRSFEFPFRLNVIQPVRFSGDTVILNGVVTGIGQDTIEDRGFVVTAADGSRFTCSSGPAAGQEEEGNFECRLGNLPAGSYTANAYAFFQGLDTLFSSETVSFTVDAGLPRFLDCGAWNTSFENDPGECSRTVTLLEAFPIEAFDNQGIHRILYRTGNQGYELLPEDYRETFPVGAAAVEFIAEDINGQTDTCAFEVTVLDTEDPEITCPDNQERDITNGGCSVGVSWPEPAATDNCRVASVERTEGPASGNRFDIGITRVSYEATDASDNTAVCSFTVTVNPDVVCPPNQSVVIPSDQDSEIVDNLEPTYCESSLGLSYTLEGATTGSGPGEASGRRFNLGVTSVIYRVNHPSGGFSDECRFEVIVRQNRPPLLVNAIPDQDADAGALFSYQFPANTFSDPDGDPLNYEAREMGNSSLPSWLSFNSATRTFSGTPDSTATGDYSIIVTASDPLGEKASGSFTIRVE